MLLKNDLINDKKHNNNNNNNNNKELIARKFDYKYEKNIEIKSNKIIIINRNLSEIDVNKIIRT